MNGAQNFGNARVLVTGGIGFIGSNLARRLVGAGAHVTLVDSLIPAYGGNLFNIQDIAHKVAINNADIRDASAIANLIQGNDYLFNLAGQTSHVDSMRDPQTDLAINATAQLSLLEACRVHNRKVKIVYTSTRQLYGKPEYLPVDERHQVRPVDVNGINKLAGEQYHLLYSNVYGIASVVLRLTNTYGPGMRVKDARQTFLGIWLRSLIDGAPIKVFGDGKQVRDFNFVDDVVDALLLAASQPNAVGQIYNLGSKEVISLRDLAAMLVRLHGRGEYEIVPFPPERQAIDIGDYYGDFSKIADQLGWTPRVGLETGLHSTLDFYSQHRRHYWESP